MQIAENKRIRIFLQDICPPFKHFKDLVYGRNKNPIYYFYFKEDKNLKKIHRGNSHWSVTLTNNVSDTMPGMGDII